MKNRFSQVRLERFLLAKERPGMVIDHFPVDIVHFPGVIDQFNRVIVYFPKVIDHFPRVIVIL